MAQKAEGAVADVEEVFRLIPIEGLLESSTNPRKSFDKEGLEELAASIKEKGILQPLLVRFVPAEKVGGASVSEHYEIIAGARRYRAAKKAGLEEVPAIVRQLDDDQVLEAQVIENLQRENVAPVEEARGFQQLVDRGHKVEELAEKIGKSARYVYARLELVKLSEPILKALDDGKITPSHAQLIATLPKGEDQKKALDHCFVESYQSGTEDSEELLVEPDHKEDLKGLVSVRDFQKTVSAMKVGSDIVGHLECLKSGGYKAFLVANGWSHGRQVLSQGRWKKQGKKPCKFPAKGVMVDGADRGKIFDICATTNCTQHFKNHPVGGAAKPADPKAAQAEAEKRRRAEEAERLKKELDRRVKLEVFRQLCGKVREVPKRILAALLANQISYEGESYGHLEDLIPGVQKLSQRAIERMLLESPDLAVAKVAVGVAIAADLEPGGYTQDLVPPADLAKDLKVNLKSLEKGIRGKFEAEQRDAKKLQEVSAAALGGVKAKKLPKKK